jgi:predicted transcriptional regulator
MKYNGIDACIKEDIVEEKIAKFVKTNSMLTKEKLKQSIDTLPDDLTIDQVIDRVILLDKIEQGLKDVEDGNVFTTEEVKARLSKWLK